KGERPGAPELGHEAADRRADEDADADRRAHGPNIGRRLRALEPTIGPAMPEKDYSGTPLGKKLGAGPTREVLVLFTTRRAAIGGRARREPGIRVEPPPGWGCSPPPSRPTLSRQSARVCADFVKGSCRSLPDWCRSLSRWWQPLAELVPLARRWCQSGSKIP